MKFSSFISFLIFLVLALLGGNFYYYRVYKPCLMPLPYTIGFIDPRQNITREQLIKLLIDAEAVWEKPTQRNLFRSEIPDDLFSRLTGRSITVNVRYDERQIKKNTITANQRELDADAQKLSQEKAALELLQNEFETQKALYESQVAAWNKGKRTSQSTYQELQSQQQKVASLQETVNERIKTYNENVATYNKKVGNFNTHSQFEDEAGTTRGRNIIDLYVLDGNESDVFLIAHELGHALGIDKHSPDESALMYYRLPKNIQGVNESDISLLTKACKW